MCVDALCCRNKWKERFMADTSDGVSYSLPRFVYGATALSLILEGLVPLECNLVPVCTGLFSVCFL